MTADILAVLATLGYGATAAFYIAHFISRRDAVGRTGSSLLYATLGLHTIWFVIRTVQIGHLPVANAVNALSFVAWGIAASYAGIEVRFGERPFGTFLVPVSFVFQTVASALLLTAPPPGPLAPILQSAWFDLHVGAALFSYCAFAIAFAAGLMHLLLFHELRLKQFGVFFNRLPALDVLERINHQAVALGFLFLTIGIGAGIVWSLGARSGPSFFDAKEISAVAVWLLYAANLHTRWVHGWRGQRQAVFSVVNFVLLFVVFFVTSFVMKAHQF